MAGFFDVKLVLCFIIICIQNVCGRCNESYNEQQCLFDVYCENSFDLANPYSGYYQYGNNYRFMDNEICEQERIKYNNRLFHPLRLVYNDFGSHDEIALVPSTDHVTDDIYIIKYLDISNNNYENMPQLKAMENLVVLNVSKNSLTTARLFNVHELPSLSEINLSHNTINLIQYPLYEHPYRRLKKINLSYNFLTDIPEAVFDQFGDLETLDISHNYISILSPISFEGIKQLINLNASFNRISDINSSLFRFSDLRQLDLSDNELNTIKVRDFNKLSHLETLTLNNNLISNIEKNAFQYMPSLTGLYLKNNKLKSIDKEAFTNTTKLVNIDMSENNFNTLPKGLFTNKAILTFSIKDNKLEGSIEKGVFEGLQFINNLDLSNQNLGSVNDYAFYGLNALQVLLLNNNNIRVLSSKCFRMVGNLRHLDLSSNKIVNLEFEKDDLYHLNSLSLRSNLLTGVKQEHFLGLNSLQFLDLSDNKINQVETNSFKSLKELINFQISNNPLSGTLRGGTFDGLYSLPSLDISGNQLATIQNGSFNGMVQLKNLNMSHSKINLVEYNIFIHTGAIENIDLSFNQLTEFKINSTELASLDTLNLNNNHIKILDSVTFSSTSRLVKLSLSNNMIENIDSNTFTNLKYLRSLDISYNSKLNYTVELLNVTLDVDVLNLSGIYTGISFGSVDGVTLSQLTISNSSVIDITSLHMNKLQRLDTLTLSYNNIAKLERKGFSNISTLRILDVSYNKITYIQPGVFKDNNLLHSLNISHNFITSVSYGVFRGLIYLQILDISYNSISDLQNERFYEAGSLSILIADHNKIESISAEDFLGTSLTQLSIGENPIPCDVLVKMKRRGVSYQITAVRLDENNNENVDGVSCNHNLQTSGKPYVGNHSVSEDKEKVLVNIRDILLNHYNHHHETIKDSEGEKYLYNITNRIDTTNTKIEHLNSDMNAKISNITNIVTGYNETNILLEKILNVLTRSAITKHPPVEVTKDNATYENLLSYIRTMKQDLQESIAVEKNNILNEVESKLALASRVITPSPTEIPKHEKLSVDSADSKSLFIETCVALILVILVGFLLFKVYKSGIFIRKNYSISTRELPGAMDSTL